MVRKALPKVALDALVGIDWSCAIQVSVLSSPEAGGRPPDRVPVDVGLSCDDPGSGAGGLSSSSPLATAPRATRTARMQIAAPTQIEAPRPPRRLGGGEYGGAVVVGGGAVAYPGPGADP
jgi:hypothetical protein